MEETLSHRIRMCIFGTNFIELLSQNVYLLFQSVM